MPSSTNTVSTPQDLPTVAGEGTIYYVISTRSFMSFAAGLWSSVSNTIPFGIWVGSSQAQDVSYFVGTSTIIGGLGIAAYSLTQPGGSPIFPNNVFLDSIQPVVRDATAEYSFGTPIISQDKKTLTIPVTRLTFVGVTVLGINVIGATTQGPAPDGTVVKITILGN